MGLETRRDQRSEERKGGEEDDMKVRHEGQSVACMYASVQISTQQSDM